jgi:hypothetical protein
MSLKIRTGKQWNSEKREYFVRKLYYNTRKEKRDDQRGTQGALSESQTRPF